MKKLFSLFVVVFFSVYFAYSQIIRHVAPNAMGSGDGLSAATAADFLEDTFWQDVNLLLRQEPVIVKFLGGNYSRAFTEKSLRISGMGNIKNNLLLEADPVNTVFTLPTGYIGTKPQVIMVTNSVNVTLRNFKFTGNGSANYVLNITTSSGNQTHNILVENCTWEDMRGVVYGATGATLEGTHHITFKNCTFKRIGLNSGSHMIYNAYSSHHISVIDSYFEDCPGDYVRFRDKCDYGVVKGCTFVHPQNIPNIKFIAMPLYNDGIPTIVNESFATNYSFSNNSFTSATSNVFAFFISNSGYSAIGFNYLLTAEEGVILTSGSNAQKKALVETNFGIFPKKIRISDNIFTGLSGAFFLGSTAGYGAVSKGWTGSREITSLLNSSIEAFIWEGATDSHGIWTQGINIWSYTFDGAGTLGSVFSAANNPTITNSVTTDSTTIGFLPASPSGSVRIQITSGAKHTLTGNKGLKLTCSDANDPAKFSAYNIPQASLVTSLAFTIQFNDSTTTRSIWTYAMGNNEAAGSTKIFDGTAALPFTGAAMSNSYPEVFNSLSWEMPRNISPAIIRFTFRDKPMETGNAVNTVINTTFFKRGETYNMEVYCNNSASDQNYLREGFLTLLRPVLIIFGLTVLNLIILPPMM